MTKVKEGRNLNFNTHLTTKIGSFIMTAAKGVPGYFYIFGRQILTNNSKNPLASLELRLLDAEDNVYGTITAVKGRNPLQGVPEKDREYVIRRWKNQSKVFDSLKEFLNAKVIHVLNPRVTEIPLLDMLWTNYVITKRFVPLDESDESMDFDKSYESDESDEVQEEAMDVEIPKSQHEMELEESVYLTMSAHCNTIHYSGISQRNENLIDRFYENPANFCPLTYGMLRVITWTYESYYGFETTFQAALTTELFLSTWDDTFAKVQEPGIRDEATNKNAWKKVIDMEDTKFYQYIKFVYDSLNVALFERKYEA